MSLIKIIREKCLDCCGGSYDAVRECASVSCPLHAYRFGKDVRRKPKVLTTEQRAIKATILAKARETRRAKATV